MFVRPKSLHVKVLTANAFRCHGCAMEIQTVPMDPTNKHAVSVATVEKLFFRKSSSFSKSIYIICSFNFFTCCMCVWKSNSFAKISLSLSVCWFLCRSNLSFRWIYLCKRTMYSGMIFDSTVVRAIFWLTLWLLLLWFALIYQHFYFHFMKLYSRVGVAMQTMVSRFFHRIIICVCCVRIFSFSCEKSMNIFSIDVEFHGNML